MVLHQHEDDLDTFLHRGHQLGRHHQVRAVADHDEDVAVRAGHPHADTACDLVTHARVAVFDVITLAVAGAPQLVQVAGHRAGRAHDDVTWFGQRVRQPDDLALVQRAAVVLDPVGRGDGVVPLLGEFSCPRAVVVGHRVSAQRLGQRLESLAGIGHQGQPALLDGVEGGDVDVDEADIRIVERGARRAGEIAVAGADSDDDVGLGGQRVGGGATGGTDGADRLRVVIGE